MVRGQARVQEGRRATERDPARGVVQLGLVTAPSSSGAVLLVRFPAFG
jgi:hypothetical protein